ncbi:MAG: hypothetical protein ACQEUZ_17235 [Pseudomonadota bacterium]
MRAALILAAAALALAACARKGDPSPPDGETVIGDPRVIAPSEVDDPVTAKQE